MSDRVKLDWKVPTSEWQKFRKCVEDEFGMLDGYLGREAELAIKQYADQDGYAGVEQRVDRLVRAAGRTPEGASQEKKSDLDKADRTRVTVRVDPDLKQQFKRVVSDGDDTLGVAFARAIRTHRDGGRAARLERKLDRVIDDAEALLSNLNEAESDNGLGKVDRNTITICNRLVKNSGDQFTDYELVGEIHDVAARGSKASEPTVERYRDLVIERLEYVPHPLAPKRIWMPEETATELMPDGAPRECLMPVDFLDEDDLATRIQLALGRRAAERENGKARLGVEGILEQILDEVPSKADVLQLMEQAALADGFELNRNGDVATLAADLNVTAKYDDDLLKEIINYRDSESEEIIDEPTETTVADYTNGPKTPSSVDAQLDNITRSATDGGGPPRDKR